MGSLLIAVCNDRHTVKCNVVCTAAEEHATGGGVITVAQDGTVGNHKLTAGVDTDQTGVGAGVSQGVAVQVQHYIHRECQGGIAVVVANIGCRIATLVRCILCGLDCDIIHQLQTNDLTLVSGTVCLGAVLDHIQGMLFGNGHNGIHIAGQTVQMDRHNGLGFIGDLLLDFRRINIVGAEIRFYKYRRSTGIGHSQSCGNKRVGGDDNLVAGTNAQGLQS